MASRMTWEAAAGALSSDPPSAWHARSGAHMDAGNAAFQRLLLDAGALRDQRRIWDMVGEATTTSVEPQMTTTSAHTAADLVAGMMARLSRKGAIDNARSRAEIIALLRIFGLGSTADRLARLDKLAEDDPQEEAIMLESLRRFAIFALGGRLPGPSIGVSSEGLVHAAWWAGDGILSMDFLPSGDIRFSAILQDVRWGAKGVMPPDRMLAEIRRFERALGGGR